MWARSAARAQTISSSSLSHATTVKSFGSFCPNPCHLQDTHPCPTCAGTPSTNTHKVGKDAVDLSNYLAAGVAPAFQIVQQRPLWGTFQATLPASHDTPCHQWVAHPRRFLRQVPTSALRGD